ADGLGSSTSSLKGKRKKKMPANPNPLFTQWLQEWKDEASEKGWKSVHTYGKALKTLRLFPLPLESGKDCKLLRNFGDKICKMLDEKLTRYIMDGAPKEHRDNNTHSNGENLIAQATSSSNKPPMPNHPGIATSRVAFSPQKRKGSNPVASTSSSRKGTAAHAISDSESEAEGQPPPQKKRAPSGNAREYVPAYRSGPYALILALYRTMQAPGYRGFMSKVELVEAAQPLSDKSFTIPDPGSRYTAWSSMGAVIRKGLVIKYSNPAKFFLTEKGQALAERLEEAEDGNTPSAVNSQSSSCQRFNTEDKDLDAALNASLTTNYEPEHNRSFNHIKRFEEDALNQSSKIAATSEPSDRLKTADINESADCSVLVVSDDDDKDDKCVISSRKTESVTGPPLKLSKRLHEISPSPSPPPHPLPKLFSSPDALKMPTCLLSSSPNISTKMEQTSTSSNVASTSSNVASTSSNVASTSSNIASTSSDIASISSTVVTAFSSVTFASSVDSDDELPDLDVPLFQRLLNRGNIRSDLLKDSAATASNKHANVEKPSSTVDSISASDAVRSKTNEAVAVIEARKNSNAGNPCVSSKSGSSISHDQISYVVSSKNQTKSVYTEKEGSHKTSIHSAHSAIPSHLASTCSSTSSVTSAIDLKQFSATCTPDFTLQPGTFDIILCLDNREFYGSKSSCKTLLPDLMKSGVQCDLRLLHVGDLLWIARERLGPQIDRVQGRELVLNYIIERKRMDDLVSSLTDGRMKEQKFRLKHCGLSETIILIEEYGSVQNFSLSEKTIKQSIVNSQMIDGFKVKRCANARDAVTYLAIMTRFLQQNFCNKTLHAVPVEQMKLLKGQQNIHHTQQYLAPFTAFNEAAVKHKDLKVAELFAKQLIQVPGVSAERAKAITSVYPTLSVLLDAYKKCSNTKDSEKLLATIKYGRNERNLGIAVSRMLHMLYTQQDSLS
ncbi:hypothetical protein EGW08_018638, partial [Elysia chlorotica]